LRDSKIKPGLAIFETISYFHFRLF